MTRNLVKLFVWILFYPPKTKNSFYCITSFFSQIAYIFGPQTESMLNQNTQKTYKYFHIIS